MDTDQETSIEHAFDQFRQGLYGDETDSPSKEVCRGGGGGRKKKKKRKPWEVDGCGRCAIRAIIHQCLKYGDSIDFGDGCVFDPSVDYRFKDDEDTLKMFAKAFVAYAEANEDYLQSLSVDDKVLVQSEILRASQVTQMYRAALTDGSLLGHMRSTIDGEEWTKNLSPQLWADAEILRGAGYFHKRTLVVRLDYIDEPNHIHQGKLHDSYVFEDKKKQLIFLNNQRFMNNGMHFDLEYHPTLFPKRDDDSLDSDMDVNSDDNYSIQSNSKVNTKKKSKKKSSKKVDKAKAEADAKARADAATDNYNKILPSANKLFSQSKLAEALQKYRDALCDHALPIGCVDASVLNKVLECLVDHTCCKQDVRALETLLSSVQHCIYFINRDDIGQCNITYFYYVNTVILGKLLSSGSDLDDDKFALYYGLLCKCVKICQSSDEIGQFGNKQKTSCTTILNKAKRQMNDRGNTFKYKSTTKKKSFLRLLEDVNTKVELVSSAKNIYNKTTREGTVEHILYELMLLGEKEVSQEDFELEFNRLRDKLGKLLTTKTKRVINLGNGLSAEHVLFVMMNYATPKTKKWKGSKWTYDAMKPTEACIGFWLQSVITCLERGTGIEKTDEHQSSCISTQDRLFWVCNTNKPRYVDEIPKVCKKARISEDTMHLIPVILLALKVKYSRMNGHKPSILATGGPVRENLFEVDDTLITRHAIFAGCVPHSEMFMRKDRFLHAYPDIEVHHKFSQRLAVFYSQQFFTTSECTFTEDWTGLGNLSPDEMEKFLEEHRKLLREIRSKGGKTTGELAQVASALHDVDWNHDDLSPVMQLRFFWCLEHKKRDLKEDEAFDEDDFIDFLIELRDSRVGVRRVAKVVEDYR